MRKSIIATLLSATMVSVPVTALSDTYFDLMGDADKAISEGKWLEAEKNQAAAMCSRPDREGAVTYSPTFAVPSAWRGLTSLFGMGRGGTPRCHHLSFSLFPVVTSLRRPVWWRKRTSWKLIRDSDPIEASECALRPSRGGGVACGTFALSTGTCVPRKGFGRLVLLGYGRCRPCTCNLSTSSSLTALCGNLILGRASCLDAFSTYPDQTRIPAVHLAVQPVNRRSVQHGPLVLVSEPANFLRPQQIETELSHDVLNPARVPL